jgi:hypothetical protein
MTVPVQQSIVLGKVKLLDSAVRKYLAAGEDDVNATIIPKPAGKTPEEKSVEPSTPAVSVADSVVSVASSATYEEDEGWTAAQSTEFVPRNVTSAPIPSLIYTASPTPNFRPPPPPGQPPQTPQTAVSSPRPPPCPPPLPPSSPRTPMSDQKLLPADNLTRFARRWKELVQLQVGIPDTAVIMLSVDVLKRIAEQLGQFMSLRLLGDCVAGSGSVRTGSSHNNRISTDFLLSWDEFILLQQVSNIVGGYYHVSKINGAL